MSALSVRDLHRAVQRHGAVYVRSKGGHAIYQGPHGIIVIPVAGRKSGVISPQIIRHTCNALGISKEEL